MIDDATIEKIIADIATHGRARLALRENNVPERDFWRRLAADDALAQQYARAKEHGMAAIAEEMLELADECRIGQIVTEGPKGKEVKTADMVDRARLQLDTRKWLLARLLPRKYGDRTILAGDAENPLNVEHHDAVSALLQRPALRDGDQGAAGEDSETIQ